MIKILVPIDFSDNATNALEYACHLAVDVSCELVVFHSYPLQPKNPFMGLEDILALEKHEESKAQENLHKYVEYFLRKNEFAKNIKIDFTTRLGFAVENVISLVDSGIFDLVIMGTKGAGNVKTKLLGTNTAVVIDNVSCPVLAVPAEARWTGIKKILLATDLDDFRFVEIKTLIMLAKAFNAQIQLVHIHSNQKKKLSFDKESFLYTVKSDLQYPDIVVFEMMEDELEDGLNQLVVDQGCNLLSMTIKNRTFFQKIFYPDISRELFYHSKVPLLAIHAEK